MTTHVYSIEFVDRQPNQRHNDTLDGAVWYGIRHFRYMDFVERMDFDTIDWCRFQMLDIRYRWYIAVIVVLVPNSNCWMDLRYSQLDMYKRHDDFVRDIQQIDRMDCR